VTFDPDLYLEHTLDVGYTGDHRVQVWWRSSHLPAGKSDFREITNMAKWRNFESSKISKFNISKNI